MDLQDDTNITKPCVSLIINSESKIGLVDTGSSVSIIKYNSLPRNCLLSETDTKISDLSKQLNILGSTKVTINFGKIKVPTLLYVIDEWSIKPDLILGTNFLNNINGTIDFGQKQIIGSINGIHEMVPIIDLSNERTFYAVHCIQNVVVDKECQICLNAKSNCPDGDYLLSPKNSHPSLLISEALVKVKNGVVPILITNPSKNSVELRGNLGLAKIESFSDLGDNVLYLEDRNYN